MLRFSDLSGWELTDIRDLAKAATEDEEYAHDVMTMAYKARLLKSLENDDAGGNP